MLFYKILVAFNGFKKTKVRDEMMSMTLARSKEIFSSKEKNYTYYWMTLGMALFVALMSDCRTDKAEGGVFD